MIFRTFDRPEEDVWREALEIYLEAFPKPGRKPDAILAGMFAKKMAYLHTLKDERGMSAMAVTGIVPDGGWLLVDYLAVRKALRGQGIGRRFVRNIADWARDKKLKGLLLEAEAEETPENAERIRFWQRSGFLLTDYVHKYVWVPETYRAMVWPFDPQFRLKDRGESLFAHIANFHKKAFSR